MDENLLPGGCDPDWSGIFCDQGKFLPPLCDSFATALDKMTQAVRHSLTNQSKAEAFFGQSRAQSHENFARAC